MRKELKLGETYEIKGTIIYVDYHYGICDGCFFQEKCSYGETVPGEIPNCEAEDREDMTDVIFVEL
jgi:hypothetical protein